MNAMLPIRLLMPALLVVMAGCSATRQPTQTVSRNTPAAKTAGPTTPRTAHDARRARLRTVPPPPPPSPPTRLSARAPAESAAVAGLMAYAPPPPAVRIAAWRGRAPDRENYAHYTDNPVKRVADHPVSTFGLDVDTGSYTNVRRMIEHGRLPPPDAVRAEGFINYFDFGYAPPTSREAPFSVTTEVAPAPWNRARQLLLVGVQGYRVPASRIPAVNLVFLVDTSGSMDEPDKLPLLKASLRQIVPRLRHRDRVAIVTYAGSAGVALASTAGDRHARILAAIDAMQAGGATNGQAGIELAYDEARKGFIHGGVNRVILATDGDFNVGQTGIRALTGEIARKRRGGIALSTLGLGGGNYNDAMAMRLADAGNGSYHYIDSLDEGRRVLVDAMASTLLTIARDVKVQIEFNPARVYEYRLIGYVKRRLRREDFNNDAVDAGDVGAGANVTALYEITPSDGHAMRIDPLRYGTRAAARTAHANELAWLRVRYKRPGQTHSRLLQRAITQRDVHARASARLRFAAALAAYADRLRGGRHLDGFHLADIARLARGARGPDPRGDRAGFVRLVELTEGLEPPVANAGRPSPSDPAGTR